MNIRDKLIKEFDKRNNKKKDKYRRVSNWDS